MAGDLTRKITLNINAKTNLSNVENDLNRLSKTLKSKDFFTLDVSSGLKNSISTLEKDFQRFSNLEVTPQNFGKVNELFDKLTRDVQEAEYHIEAYADAWDKTQQKISGNIEKLKGEIKELEDPSRLFGSQQMSKGNILNYLGLDEDATLDQIIQANKSKSTVISTDSRLKELKEEREAQVSLNNSIQAYETNQKGLLTIQKQINAAKKTAASLDGRTDEGKAANREVKRLEDVKQEYKDVIKKQNLFYKNQTGTSLNDANLVKEKTKINNRINEIKKEEEAQENLVRQNKEASSAVKELISNEQLLAAKNQEVTNSTKTLENGSEQAKREIKEFTTSIDGMKNGLAIAGAAIPGMEADLERLNHQARLDNFATGLKHLTAFTVALQFVRTQIREVATTYMDLDEGLTQIAVVSGRTRDEMWGMIDTYNEMAQRLGATTQQVVESSKLYFQQGRTQSEVMELVEQTTVLATISELEFADATEFMTAAINGFNLEANQAVEVTDVWANLAAKAAVDADELATALSKVASLAGQAGMTVETTSAFLTNMIETTREAPENLGTALKTIISRFQNLTSDPELSLEDGIDVNKVEAALASVDVQLRDTSGEFRDFDDVILDLSKDWDTLSRNQQAYIATVAAGSRQQSRFIALVEDYDRNLELIAMAENSAGAGAAQFATQLTGLQASVNRLKSAWEGLYTSLNEGHNIVSGLIEIAANILSLASKMGLEATALTVTLGFLAAKFLIAAAAGSTQAISTAISTDKLQDNTLATIANYFAKGRLAVADGTASASGAVFTASLIKNTKALLAQAAAFVAINIKALIVIGAIAALTAGIWWAVTAREREIESLKELSTEYGNAAAAAQQEVSSLQSLETEYQNAYENGDDLTTIQQKLIDQFPELANEIDLTTASYNEASEALREYIELQNLVAAEEAIDQAQTDRDTLEVELAPSIEQAEENLAYAESGIDPRTLQSIEESSLAYYNAAGELIGSLEDAQAEYSYRITTGELSSEDAFVDVYFAGYNFLNNRYDTPEALQTAFIEHYTNELDSTRAPLTEQKYTVQQRGQIATQLDYETEDPIFGSNLRNSFVENIQGNEIDLELSELQDRFAQYEDFVVSKMQGLTDLEKELVNNFLSGNDDNFTFSDINFIQELFGEGPNNEIYNKTIRKQFEELQETYNAELEGFTSFLRTSGIHINAEDLPGLENVSSDFIKVIKDKIESNDTNGLSGDDFVNLLLGQNFSSELQSAIADAFESEDLSDILNVFSLLEEEIENSEGIELESLTNLREQLSSIFNISDYGITDFFDIISSELNDLNSIELAFTEGFEASSEDFQNFAASMEDTFAQLGISANEAFVFDPDLGTMRLTQEAYEALTGAKIDSGMASIESARAELEGQRASLTAAKEGITANKEKLESDRAKIVGEQAGAQAAISSANETITANNDIIKSINPLLAAAGLPTISSAITATGANASSVGDAVALLDNAISIASAAEGAIDSQIANIDGSLAALGQAEAALNNFGGAGGGSGGGGGGGSDDAADAEKEYVESLKETADALKEVAEEEQRLQEQRIEYINKVLEERQKALEKENELLEEQIENSQEAQEIQLEAFERYLERRIEALEDFQEELERALELAEKLAEESTEALELQAQVAEDYYNDQVELIDKQIDALKEKNEEENLALELAKAQDAYERSRNDQNRLVLVAGAGWTWQRDREQLEEDRLALNEAELNVEIANLEKEKELLEEQAALWEETAENIGKSTSELEKYNQAYSQFSSMSDADRAEALKAFAEAIINNNQLNQDVLDKENQVEWNEDEYAEGSIANQIKKLEEYQEQVGELLDQVGMDYDEFVKEMQIEQATIALGQLFDSQPVENLQTQLTSLTITTKAHTDNLLIWGKQIEDNEKHIEQIEEAMDAWDDILDDLGKSTSELNEEAALFAKYNAMTTDQLSEGSEVWNQAIIDAQRLAAAWEAANNAQAAYEAADAAYNASQKSSSGGSYAGGGVVDYTGTARVHGTSGKPEVMLNNAQATALWNFLDGRTNPFGAFDKLDAQTSARLAKAQSVVNDNKIIYDNCTFEIQSDANNIEDLLKDIRRQSPLRKS